MGTTQFAEQILLAHRELVRGTGSAPISPVFCWDLLLRLCWWPFCGADFAEGVFVLEGELGRPSKLSENFCVKRPGRFFSFVAAGLGPPTARHRLGCMVGRFVAVPIFQAINWVNGCCCFFPVGLGLFIDRRFLAILEGSAGLPPQIGVDMSGWQGLLPGVPLKRARNRRRNCKHRCPSGVLRGRLEALLWGLSGTIPLLRRQFL